jgi:hypothetical protein
VLFWFVLTTYEVHSSVCGCGMHTDLVHGCFGNPEGLNNGHLPSRRGPRVHELANGLRLGTVVPVTYGT